MIEYHNGAHSPSVCVIDVDSYVVHIVGDETYSLSRKGLSDLRELIDKALNTSPEEIADALG